MVLTCIVGEPSMREHPFPPAVDNSTYVIRWSTSCRGGVSGGTGEVLVADTNLNDGGSISGDGYFRWLIVNGRVLARRCPHYAQVRMSRSALLNCPPLFGASAAAYL